MKREGLGAWLLYAYRLVMLALHFVERVVSRRWQRLRAREVPPAPEAGAAGD